MRCHLRPGQCRFVWTGGVAGSGTIILVNHRRGVRRVSTNGARLEDIASAPDGPQKMEPVRAEGAADVGNSLGDAVVGHDDI